MNFWKTRICFWPLLLLGSLAFSQEAAPAPDKEAAKAAEPKAAGGKYEFRTDLTLGGFFTDIHGSEEKYRSDINLRSGARLENFQTEIRPEEGSSGWFDLATFRARGFGSVDPYEDFQFNIRRNGKYDFRLKYSKDNYYFQLPGFALGMHSDDNIRRRVSADLNIHVRKSLQLRMGYRNWSRSGNSFTSQLIFQSLFPVLQYNRGRTDEYYAGMEWKTKTFGLSFDQRFRSFRFDDSAKNAVSSAVDPTLGNRLTGLTRNTPVRGMVPESTLLLKWQPSARIDLLGRYTYSSGSFDFSRWELQNLRIGASGAQLEQLALTQASTDQPLHRLDLNATWDIATHWTLQNSFYLNRYRLLSDGLLSYAMRSPGSSGSLNLSETVDDTLRYQRGFNETSLQFSPSRLMSIRGGYRYTNRQWEQTEEGSAGTRQESNMQAAVLSWTASSGTRWRSSLELEHGWMDEALIRLEPLRFNRWTARGAFRPAKGWQVSASLGIRDDLSRTRSVDHEGDFREFSLQLNWMPKQDYTFDLAYGRTDILSATDIYFLLTVPRKVSSRYVTNMNYFNFHCQFPLHKRVLGQANYNVVDDSAGSYPLVFHQAGAGLSFRVQGPAWLDLHWRYLAYNEEQFSQQDYAGHLLGISMRFGF